MLTFALIAGINWLTSRFSDAWILVVPSGLILVPLTFALLFRYAPSFRACRGATSGSRRCLCGGTWIAAVEVLALYGAFFGKNFNAYGAVGAVLVVMLWMKAVSQGLFFGAELCKVISQRDSPRVT